MKERGNQTKAPAAAVPAVVIAGMLLFVLATAVSARQSERASGSILTVPRDLWQELIPADNPLTR